MNIQDIKTQIARENNVVITKLDMVRQYEDKEKTIPTNWLGFWIDEKRIRVVMHQDVMALIKANPMMDTIALKKEVVEESETSKAYLRYVVITPKHIEASF
jgi:hypothetical protein